MGAITERIVAQGHGALSPSYLCVHSTANPGATAANHASLWSREPAYAVHLVSDWRECLHAVPYDRLCWQVGNGNPHVEGIEICEATNRADFDAGIGIAARAVAERLAAHGWGTDRLITHREAARRWGGSDHTDPYPYFERFGYTWGAFVAKVSGYLGGAAAGEEGEEDDMQCIIKPNGLNVLCWFDGQRLHDLDNQDEVIALDAVYRATHGGKPIPVVALGEVGAPYASRLVQAIEAPAPSAGVAPGLNDWAKIHRSGN